MNRSKCFWCVFLVMTGCAASVRSPAGSGHTLAGSHVVLHLRDGAELYGTIHAEDDKTIDLETHAARQVAVAKSDIVRIDRMTSQQREGGVGAGGVFAIVLGSAIVAGGGLFLLAVGLSR